MNINVDKVKTFVTSKSAVSPATFDLCKSQIQINIFGKLGYNTT